jgi:hypothetical protein
VLNFSWIRQWKHHLSDSFKRIPGEFLHLFVRTHPTWRLRDICIGWFVNG